MWAAREELTDWGRCFGEGRLKVEEGVKRMRLLLWRRGCTVVWRFREGPVTQVLLVLTVFFSNFLEGCHKQDERQQRY